MADLRQTAWSGYIARAGLGDDVPLNLGEVIRAVAAFVDPLIRGQVNGREWDPARRRWT